MWNSMPNEMISLWWLNISTKIALMMFVHNVLFASTLRTETNQFQQNNSFEGILLSNRILPQCLRAFSRHSSKYFEINCKYKLTSIKFKWIRCFLLLPAMTNFQFNRDSMPQLSKALAKEQYSFSKRKLVVLYTFSIKTQVDKSRRTS